MTVLLLEGANVTAIVPLVSLRAPLSEPVPPAVVANINSTPIVANLVADLAAINTQLALIPVLENATAAQIVPLHNAVESLWNDTLSAIAQYDGDISTTTVAGLAPNIAAPQLWPILLNQLNDSTQLAILLNLRGYVGRIRTNIHAVLGPGLSLGLPGPVTLLLNNPPF